MTKQEYLKNLKVGDTVRQSMHGAGFITDAGEEEVVHISNGTIWLCEYMENDSDYKKDSMYAYNASTGIQNEKMFGMFKTIELPDWKAPN